MLSRSLRFLKDVQTIIESRLDETTFSVSDLSRTLEISESTLRRKVQQLTGLPPKLYIRQIRLNKAKELLENDAGTVYEIAGIVGFSNPAYFAKCFQEQFGVVPSLYRKELPKQVKGSDFLKGPGWETCEDN
jgi:AraC-like DNA-binding protein